MLFKLGCGIYECNTINFIYKFYGSLSLFSISLTASMANMSSSVKVLIILSEDDQKGKKPACRAGFFDLSSELVSRIRLKEL